MEVTSNSQEWWNMKKRYLRLVVSHDCECKQKPSLLMFFTEIKNKIQNSFISRREKIYIIKDILTKIYRDYEITTGIMEEPYFIRAENKLRCIVKDNKIDYYYDLLKKHRNKIFY